MVLQSPDGAPASAVTADADISATRSAVRDLSFGLDRASQAGTTLLTAVLTLAGLGWLLDRWLGTGPWLVAIGALVGNAAGIYLLYLSALQMDDRPAGRRSTDADVPEDDDDGRAVARDTLSPTTKGPTR